MKELVRAGDDWSDCECDMQDLIGLPHWTMYNSPFRTCECAFRTRAHCVCHMTPFGRNTPYPYGVVRSNNVTGNGEDFVCNVLRRTDSVAIDERGRAMASRVTVDAALISDEDVVKRVLGGELP